MVKKCKFWGGHKIPIRGGKKNLQIYENREKRCFSGFLRSKTRTKSKCTRKKFLSQGGTRVKTQKVCKKCNRLKLSDLFFWGKSRFFRVLEQKIVKTWFFFDWLFSPFFGVFWSKKRVFREKTGILEKPARSRKNDQKGV